jgi:hypothetical protein
MKTRRQFLYQASSIAALAGVGVGSLASCSNSISDGLILSAAKSSQGQFKLAAARPNGRIVWQHDIDVRGHDVAVNSAGTISAFVARRPGKTVWLLDSQSGSLLQTLKAPPRTQFNGHAAFSVDGNQLYVTETSYPGNIGQIGVYNLSSGKRQKSFLSGGLDPHQCALDPSNNCLVIANGGRLEQEHRTKQWYLDSERPPNVSWVNPHNGQLIAQHHLDQPQLSLRHFDITDSGVVVVGSQTNKGNSQPILHKLSALRKPQPFVAEPSTWASLNGYIASISLLKTPGSHYAMATSPKGSRWITWDINSLEIVASGDINDVSGACHSPEQFLLTSGLGKICSPDDVVGTAEALAFDNHCQFIAKT